MNEEKMKILKMLEDGRISSEDAARLLESLSGSPSSGRSRSPESPISNNSRYSSDTTTANKFDDFASDISKKIEVLARDMEPKLQKLTDVVAEKTANVADRLSKSLTKESIPREMPPTPRSDSVQNSLRMDSEKTHEIIVSPGNNELNITGLNGNVTIKGYNGDKITAKIYARQKSAGFAKGGTVEFMKLGSKYVLHYDEESVERLSVDAYVPEALFQNIHIETNNGALDVTNLKGHYLNIANSNGNTTISHVMAENIEIDCNNGRLDISELSAKNGKIENFNGDISVTDVDISNLKLIGLNGSLTMLLRSLSRYADYTWAVETSNGRIIANLPSGLEYGYHINAHTALSEIKVGLTGLNYFANSPSLVEAQSFRFKDSPKKMKISLETSNWPLTIN